MRLTRTALPVALLALMGCAPSPSSSAPSAAAPAAATTAAQPESALGRTVSNAMEKARQEMATKNIEINGGVRISRSGKGVAVFDGNGNHDGRPKAEITPKGDLLIAGAPVAINDSQRALLLDYRGEVIGVASAGMDLGVEGADMASKAVHAAIDSIFSGGKGPSVDQKMEAEGARMKAKALELCKLMPPMLATQQKLAASLPPFKPYATMTQSDIDDCMKDDESHAHASNDAASEADSAAAR